MRQTCKKLTNPILTKGGVIRTLRAGHPEHTMHLWWTGTIAPREPDAPVTLDGAAGQPQEFVIELELLRIEGTTAVVRLWAPEQVKIISAQKDPHCLTD